MATPVKLIWGAAQLSPHPETGEVTHVNETLDLLRSLGVEDLDTAQVYGDSEETLGKAKIADKKFIVSTKQGGGFKPGTGTKEGVLEHGAYASEKLGPIDVYYLHAPDDSIPLEDTLEGIQKLYETGAFERFGLSNYLPEDIQKVYDIASSRSWVKPTVFQGNYNPFSRAQESTTFPLLRKLGISFYAYSPLAGGLLAKTKEQLAIAAGRWAPGTPFGDIYRALYDKEELRSALDDWEEVAKKEGISLAELGYRWVRHHSSLESQYGDGIIFGAYDEARIRQTVGWLNNGPLSEEAAKGIDAIWEKIKDVAPVDNYNSLRRKA